MASVTLNTGATIPSLGFGTGTALYGSDAAKEIQQAIEAGYYHLDAASVYANEESVGQGIKNSGIDRSKLFITTKSAMGTDVRGSLEASLKKLQLDHVDLYLIHSPVATPPAAAWPIMEELLKEGKAKAIGVSNFRVSDFESFLPAAKVVPAVNQIEFNPYTYKSSVPLLELMRTKGIKVEAYSPLSPLTKFSGKGRLDDVLAKIAEKKGVSTGVVLLAWSKQVGDIAVTTSGKKERLLEQLKVQTTEPLTEEEVKAITDAGSELHFRGFMMHMDE